MKNSKKILSIVIGLTLISSTALFAEEAKVATEKATEKTVAPAVSAVPAATTTAKAVATVNGASITKETLDAYMAVINRSRPEGVPAKEALDDLIITELAVQQAKKDGIADRVEVKKQIAEAAKKVILTTWTREKSENMKISDAELKVAYDESMKEQESKEYKARHILVKKEDIAKAIIKEIEGGGDFEKLAKAKSTGPSGPKGGDLGWFKATTMVPPFAKAVEAMKKGDVSKVPVKTNFGWHVIKLEEVRDVKLPTFESMKPQMKPMLAQKKMIEYIESLRTTADVKIMLPKEEAKPVEATVKPTDTATTKTAEVKPADTATTKTAEAKPADTATEKKEEAKPTDTPATK